MHSYPLALHESRKLKQARPFGQYVDLLRRMRLLLPHNGVNIAQISIFVNICRDGRRRFCAAALLSSYFSGVWKVILNSP